MRWGDYPWCPKCGAENPYRITRKTPSKNKTRRLFKCRVCKRQFTATVGKISSRQFACDPESRTRIARLWMFSSLDRYDCPIR